uniref:cytotoxic necrotizing factor Rho-activating domain-containing protein n=1 Tax=Cedecea davisae TaxID=158484 RepID=UPI001D0AF81C|nr:cytotoxic necrotizing factor Rho-activating domain-containing protein [Cedecea davisae]
MNISDCKGTSWQSAKNIYQSEPPTTQNIDPEEEVYFDAYDDISEPTTPILSTGKQALQNSEPDVGPVSTLCGHIVDKILYSISLRVLSRLGGLEALHTDLRELAQSREALSNRLRLLCELLARYHKHVPAHYRPLLNNLNELARAGLSIYQLSAIRLPTLCGEIRQFSVQAEYLLSLTLVKKLLPTTQLNQLSRLPAQMRKMADILLQAQLMPEDTSLEEWLLIIQQHDVLPEPLQQMLAGYTQLLKQLRALYDNSGEIARRYPLPSSSNWAECINWTLQLLNDPRATRHITANFPSAFVETLKLSESLLRVSSQFPAEGTLVRQLEWIRQNVKVYSSELGPLLAQQPFGEFINTLSRKMVNPTLFDALIVLANPASSLREKSNQIISLCLRNFRFRGGVQLEWIRQNVKVYSSELGPLLAQQPFGEFINTLSRKMVNPTLFDALIVLANPASSLREKSNQIISLCLRNFRFRGGVDYAMRKTVTTFTGGSLVLSTWDWYQQLPTGLSWQQTAERFVSEMTRQVNSTPQLLRELLPDYFIQSAGMLSDLVALPVGQPWQETLRWGIRRLGLSRVNDWLSQRYIELCLIRGVCESLQQGDAMQREAILRDLSASLKDYFALRPDSELAGLIDLLPYLPLLSGLHDTIKQIPHTNSWLTWATSLLDAIEQHPHPALITLRDQMETQVANYLSDGLVATFDSLWEQLPEFSDPLQFPAAAALPLAQKYEGAVQKAETESLLNLFNIAVEYSEGKDHLWVEGDIPATNKYGVIAGLAAGWIAALSMLYRTYYQPSMRKKIPSEAELQAHQPLAVTREWDNIMHPAKNSHVKKYIVPVALVTGMSAVSAWVVSRHCDVEKTLTLQQVFRDMLDGSHAYRTQTNNTAPAGNKHRKREAPSINNSAAQKSLSELSRDITLPRLEANFKLWNISSNKKLEALYTKFLNLLGNFHHNIKNESVIIFAMALITTESISTHLEEYFEEKKSTLSNSEHSSKLDIDYVIYGLIFIEKTLRRVNKITERTNEDGIIKTNEYKRICHFMRNDLPDSLAHNVVTHGELHAIIYNFMCSSILFPFTEYPELKYTLEHKNSNLLWGNCSGVYGTVVYSAVKELIVSHTYQYGTQSDILIIKKEALIFYVNKAREAQKENNKDVLWDEVEYLISGVGHGIISNMEVSNNERNIKEVQSIISSTTPTFIDNEDLDIYRKLWGKCNQSHLDMISLFATKKNSQHEHYSYISAATDAINDLLTARVDISRSLINNFTDLPGSYQQYALSVMISIQIDKIISFRKDWYKSQYYWDIIIKDQTINNSIIRLYQTSDDTINRIIDMIKSQAVKILLKEINVTPVTTDAIGFYNEIVTSNHYDYLVLKEEMKVFMQTGMYLLYQYITKKPVEYKQSNFSPSSYYSLDINKLEQAAVPYITGSAFEKNSLTLTEINTKAEKPSVTAAEFYTLYNEYIRHDALADAMRSATILIYHYGDRLLTWGSIAKKIKNIKNFKYTHESYMLGLSLSDYLLESKSIGEVKIITLDEDEEYLYSNFLGYPVFLLLEKDIKSNLGPLPGYEQIYDIAYKNSKITDKEKFTKITPQKDNDYNYLIKVDAVGKDLTDYDTIKDILIYEFYRQYVNAASAQQHDGQRTILDTILDLVPLYSILERKINDPMYRPTFDDMKWDVINIGTLLSIPGIKIGSSSFLALRRIFLRSAEVLEETTPALGGIDKYRKIIQLSLSEVAAKLPRARDSLISTLAATTDVLNPVEFFQTVGRNIIQTLGKSIQITPSRVRRLPTDGQISMSFFLPQLNINPPYIELQSLSRSINDEFEYIDEMTSTQLATTINQLPGELIDNVILKSFSGMPEGQSEEASRQVINILQQHGYNTRIIGCLLYKSPLDSNPFNYYAVLASKTSDELMIDITFEQLIPTMLRQSKPMYSSWDGWVREITKTEKLKNNLIIIKQFDSLDQAKAELNFSSGVNYLESNNIRDSSFQIINIPTRFIKHCAQVYFRDIHWGKSPAVLSLFDSLDIRIAEQRTKLEELHQKESDYINKSLDIPQRIEQNINNVKSYLYALEEISHLPNRLFNYPYFNQRQFLTENKKIIFSTPVSSNIVSLLSTPEAISHAQDITHAFLEMIDFVDKYGLLYVENKTYLANNGMLYSVHNTSRAGSNHLLLKLGNKNVNMYFVNFRWVLDSGTIISPQQKTTSITKEFLLGSTMPLRNKGLLNTHQSSPILTQFEFFRSDKIEQMSAPKRFTQLDLNNLLKGKASTTTGNNLTSLTPEGPLLGTWKKGDLSEDIDFIFVCNGNSGCIGIRIAFEEIQPERPVIISAGDLSGCTMIYATDDSYFYAYHAGRGSAKSEWLTSQDGVKSIYDAHLALKGTTLHSMSPVDLKNQDLPLILSDYNSSLITYLGKNTLETGDTRIAIDEYSGIRAFDYNNRDTPSGHVRLGLAYAVISKSDEIINAVAYSEDLSISIETNKIKTLSSQHQRLAGLVSNTNNSIFDTSEDTLSDLYTAFSTTLENSQ